MARQKRRRFAALEKMDNVVDERRSEPGWFDRVFGVDRPVALELGCGRGEYTLALARSRPGAGVLGVDRNGARLWCGAVQARVEGLIHAFFFRASVEHVNDHVPDGRVSEVWLPFPDPLRKTRQSKHRLVAPAFLERYRLLLRQGGSIHLKTDDRELLDFALQSIRDVGGHLVDGADSSATDPGPDGLYQTAYERRYRGNGQTIFRRTFRLD